jgi:hypothetical protein
MESGRTASNINGSHVIAIHVKIRFMAYFAAGTGAERLYIGWRAGCYWLSSLMKDETELSMNFAVCPIPSKNPFESGPAAAE